MIFNLYTVWSPINYCGLKTNSGTHFLFGVTTSNTFIVLLTSESHIAYLEAPSKTNGVPKWLEVSQFFELLFTTKIRFFFLQRDMFSTARNVTVLWLKQQNVVDGVGYRTKIVILLSMLQWMLRSEYLWMPYCVKCCKRLYVLITVWSASWVLEHTYPGQLTSYWLPINRQENIFLRSLNYQWDWSLQINFISLPEIPRWWTICIPVPTL